MKRKEFIKTISAGAASVSVVNPFFVGAAINDELSYHKIEKFFIKKVEIIYPRHVGKNAVKGNHGWGYEETVCELITNQGARGWGVPLWGKSLAENKDYVVGKKVSDLFSPSKGLIDLSAAYWDIALHDLAGNILNKPVYELMGAEFPESTSCYSGMIYFDDLTSYFNKPAGIDIILKECQFDYDLGYRQFKLKIGRGNKWMNKSAGIQRDIEVTKLVASAFPNCDILVDGNDGYTVDELELYLKGIDGIKLFWIEEPFRESVEDYTKLNSLLNEMNIDTMLADGEYNPDQKFIKELLKKRLIGVHLSDIQSVGLGYTRWRRLLPELKELNVYGSPHAWGSQLKTNVIAHLAASIGNIITVEGVTNISDDIDLGDYKLENGKLVPSSSPGFGMKLLV
jgi:L-alanine-DL-glutamate epimerase-like enolase superfamily enzyme